MTTLAWVLGLALGLSFICSILEAVLLSLTHSYVELLREKGTRAGAFLHRMQKRIDEPISAILTLNTIAGTGGAALSGALALRVFGQEWMALFSAALTLSILLFAEILPKTLGATYWRTLAPAAAWTLQILIWILKPILIPLGFFSSAIARGQKDQFTVSRAELEVLAQIGRREGTLGEEEWKVVTNIINLEAVSVGEVMTPRTDMVAVPSDATVEDAKSVMLDEGHLRLPVFDGSVDRIVGILLARDLWQADREGATDIRAIIRPPFFAPAGKPVQDLLIEMRRQRSKMVIVLDEFGGTAGLATLEDLIEEIVGEIQDEHEADEPLDFQEGPTGLRIWGGVPLREVEDRLGVELPDDQYDTLGGYIFGHLNRMPREGDVAELPEGGGRFEVIRMRGRRVEFVRYTPTLGVEEPGSPQSEGTENKETGS
ncbi:MAG: HlyC/CorC family transporter [Gemmatimonadales bacterium]|nr:MAG: HlyC/CorC family transporter [Gemmatimonadales bacterium]